MSPKPRLGTPLGSRPVVTGGRCQRVSARPRPLETLAERRLGLGGPVSRTGSVSGIVGRVDVRQRVTRETEPTVTPGTTLVCTS